MQSYKPEQSQAWASSQPNNQAQGPKPEIKVREKASVEIIDQGNSIV